MSAQLVRTAADTPAQESTKTGCKREVCCRLCGTLLEYVFADLGLSPLANSYPEPSQLNQMEPFYPLRVHVCSRCFLVQLEEFVSPREIFSEYTYFSSYSDTWLQHAKAYVDMAIERFALNAQSQVVELASNDGYLLQYFVASGIPVLGIEPAANVAEAAAEKGVPTIVKFFSEESARELVGQGIRADLVVGNNVLAHVPKLNDFVSGLKNLLKPLGVITLEFPHLFRLIEENQFDTIYHEHFSYFSFLSAEQVLAAHDLTVFDVEELPTHGGSLRIYARHSEDSSLAVGERVAEMKAREEAAGLTYVETYLSFAERVKETKRRLLQFLIAVKQQGKSIVGYGAPAKGNTLLNYCGIRSDFIDYTVDRSPHKQGHFLPGTRIPIFPPAKIRETKPDYLLILPWNLKDEIVREMAYIREWGGQFVVPIPEVKVFRDFHRDKTEVRIRR
jgi:2-polyprenyl-3-methyl-5-hydroxy-6-metoxy-1,4-benzoquinol methylase